MKVNKKSAGKIKATKTNIPSLSAQGSSTDRVQGPLSAPREPQMPQQCCKSRTQFRLKQADPDDEDYHVRDSEDEFTDEHRNEFSQPSEDSGNSESEHATEPEGQESNASGLVVIAPISEAEINKQQQELKILSHNPHFQNVGKDMVDAVLSSLNVTKTGRSVSDKNSMYGKYVWKVVRNKKTPSDTTIYAPALNLMPDKNTNNNKSRPGQNLGPVSEQQLTEFLNFEFKLSKQVICR